MASFFLIVFLIIGLWIYSFNNSDILKTFLLIVPIVFSGHVFNYQDNQRTLEATARYIDTIIKPKYQASLEWEHFFSAHKKNYQFSSAYKVFSLILPFVLPIILLMSQKLSSFQITLAIIDLALLIIILTNFRYKLYRIK